MTPKQKSTFKRRLPATIMWNILASVASAIEYYENGATLENVSERNHTNPEETSRRLEAAVRIGYLVKVGNVYYPTADGWDRVNRKDEVPRP